MARNAAATIERAVLSVVSQSRARILLVDDFSTDQTSFLALQAGKGQCTVERPPMHLALGATRGFGLSKVTTKYTILLDADDAYLPGRIDRAVTELERSNAQIWADGLRLRDGASGALLKEIPVPQFLRLSRTPYRLFERNYLPGVGQIAFVTDAAQRVGYDPFLNGAEDFDLVLRMLANGAQFSYDDAIGYEMFTYPSSLSRRLDNQLEMYARSLHKFSLPYIKLFYTRCSSDLATAIWACVNVSMYRSQYSMVLEFMDELDSEVPIASALYVHEPNGPSPYPEIWRRLFTRGTALLLLGDNVRAMDFLQSACALVERPESVNNFGIGLRMAGAENMALKSFEKAIQLNKDFFDARTNLNSINNLYVTRHPLRFIESRNIYA